MRNVPRLAALAASLLVGEVLVMGSEESMRRLRVVETPEDLATLYSDAQGIVTYDPTSGRFYYPSLGLYLDPVTSMFYDPSTGAYRDYALRGEYSYCCMDDLYYDAVSGRYFDAARRMSFDSSTGLYQLDGRNFVWDSQFNMLYDPDSKTHYDRGLETDLSYDASLEMFYDKKAGQYYDPALGLYYDEGMGMFFDPICGRYYDRDAQMYYDPNTGRASLDADGAFYFDPMENAYYNEKDGCWYCHDDETGLYIDQTSSCDMGMMMMVMGYGPRYYDPETEFHFIYNGCNYVVEETGDLYDPGSQCYFDLYNWTSYRYDSETGGFVGAMSDMSYTPYWLESGCYAWKADDDDSAQGNVDLSTMTFCDWMGMYYDSSTMLYYDAVDGMYYDGMSYYRRPHGDSYWYDSMGECYVSNSTGERYVPSRSVDLSRMTYDSMMDLYRDDSTGLYYDAKIGLYTDFMCYYRQPHGDCYYFDSIQNAYVCYSSGDVYYPHGQIGAIGGAYDQLTEEQLAEIQATFMALDYLTELPSEVETMTETRTEMGAYTAAPFGFEDALWFKELMEQGMSYCEKRIRLRRGVMPNTLEVSWAYADQWTLPGYEDYNMSGMVVPVSEALWNRAERTVVFTLNAGWNSFYSMNALSIEHGGGGMGCYDAMGCYVMDAMGEDILANLSESDRVVYNRYAGDWEMLSFLANASYGGAWAISTMYGNVDLMSGGGATVGGLQDTDGDGLSDLDEIRHGTNPFVCDTDGDGMSDALEIRIGSCPTMCDPDSDCDGMADVWEEYFGFNPSNAVDANADPDHDGLNNQRECWLGTNPRSADTDGDGLRDGDELKHGTQPCNPDTDNDQLPDGAEVARGTNPCNPDTDGDGLADGEEEHLKTNPLLADSDGDGLSDYYEFIEGLNPNSRDTDSDGLDDKLELYYGTDPCWGYSLCEVLNDGMFKDCFRHNAEEILPQVEYLADNFYLDSGLGADYAKANDLDCDGLTDWCELLLGTDPLDPDSDYDGLYDGGEFMVGTDPLNPDTDGDGLSDWDELARGANPLKECSLLVGLKDGFAIMFDGCGSPLEVMPDGRTAYEHVLYTGDVYGEIDDTSSFGSGQAMVTFLVKSYVGNPATLHVGDLEIPLLPNAEVPIKVNVPVGEDVEVYSDFRHWKYGDWEAEDRYRSEFGNTFDYYNEKVEFMVVDANEFTVFRNDYWNPGDDRRHLLTSYRFPESPLCIHDKVRRELDKYFEDVQVDTYWGDGVVCNWELVENTKDVEFTDMSNGSYSVGVHVKASFPDSERRHCRLTYQHPNYVAGPTSKILEVRYCPEFHSPELSEEVAGVKDGGNADEDISVQHQTASTSPGEVTKYLDVCPFVNETNSTEMVVAPDQLILRKYKDNKREYFADNVLLPIRIIDHAQVKYDEFREAPKGQCCPCPDHAHKHVDIFASSRVELFGENFCEGTDSIVNFPTTIYTVGRRPSRSVEDALVLFTTNGAEYVKHRYTVLGVNIEVPNVDLDRFNKLSDELGMPMLVGTNVLSSVLRESDGAPSQTLRSAPILDLKCNVGLSSGVVRLSLGKVEGHFKVVAVGRNNDVTVLMDTAESKQVQWKLEDWWKLVDSEAKIRLVAVTRGSCDVHFSYGTVQNNQLYRDAVSQRFTAVYPLILPDYNRDGKIDDEDAYSYQNGRMYYFWSNQDGKQWSGDCSTTTSSSKETELNSSDNRVNGRMDLVNFAPFATTFASVLNNMKSVRPTCLLSIGTRSPDDSASVMKFAFVDGKWSEVGDVHEKDINVLPENGCSSKQLHEAPLVTVCREGGGYEFGGNVLECLKSNTDSGMIVGEFTSTDVTSIKVGVYTPEVSPGMAICFDLPICILDVYQMQRWINIRGKFMKETLPTAASAEDVKWPDSEHANANLIFIHGYNVNEKESREWGRAVFKHLWWSGLDAGFTIVSWAGSIGQKKVFGGVTPNFYTNIISSVCSAPILVKALENVPGEHFIMAHSLGNFLASVARQDCGLKYKQFFMVNAAVPVEAYDSTTNVLDACAHKGYCTKLKQRIAMTPQSWQSFNPVYYCNHWYDLFSATDGRHGLTWKDRFKDVDNTVNYYSSEDEVLANGDGTREFLLCRDHIWYNGEHHKGTLPKFVFAGKGSHAGWGFRSRRDRSSDKEKNDEYLIDPVGVKRTLRSSPLFKDFSLSSLCSLSGSSVASDYMNRQQLLAFEIPAESFATGANPVPKWDGEDNDRNVDMADYSTGVAMLKKQKWIHSAFATRPHHRVHELYDDIAKRIKKAVK